MDNGWLAIEFGGDICCDMVGVVCCNPGGLLGYACGNVDSCGGGGLSERGKPTHGDTHTRCPNQH